MRFLYVLTRYSRRHDIGTAGEQSVWFDSSGEETLRQPRPRFAGVRFLFLSLKLAAHWLHVLCSRIFTNVNDYRFAAVGSRRCRCKAHTGEGIFPSNDTSASYILTPSQFRLGRIASSSSSSSSSSTAVVVGGLISRSYFRLRSDAFSL